MSYSLYNFIIFCANGIFVSLFSKFELVLSNYRTSFSGIRQAIDNYLFLKDRITTRIQQHQNWIPNQRHFLPIPIAGCLISSQPPPTPLHQLSISLRRCFVCIAYPYQLYGHYQQSTLWLTTFQCHPSELTTTTTPSTLQLPPSLHYCSLLERCRSQIP